MISPCIIHFALFSDQEVIRYAQNKKNILLNPVCVDDIDFCLVFISEYNG